jgi:hypothetical protein
MEEFARAPPPILRISEIVDLNEKKQYMRLNRIGVVMGSAKSKSISTSLPAPLETRVRTISSRENRSVANVVENAVRVFTLLPKDLRDVLVEMSAEEKTAYRRFEQVSRRFLFELARLRYEQASVQLAASDAKVDDQMLVDDEAQIIASPVR